VLEVGRVHNKNKNPTAEHAIGELRCELKRINPEGGPVSTATLAIATSRLNSRLRRGGLSALESMCCRDQYTHSAISVSDRELISQQQSSRVQNHPYDYVSQSRSHGRLPPVTLAPGDLVYNAVDRDKTKARPRYLVTSVDGEWCLVRKFSGSQLRSKQYRFRLSECYLVSPTVPQPSVPNQAIETSSDEDEEGCVPPEISDVPTMQASPVPPPCAARLPSPVIAPRERPRRQTRLPRRFDDFVVTMR